MSLGATGKSLLFQAFVHSLHSCTWLKGHQPSHRKKVKPGEQLKPASGMMTNSAGCTGQA